MTPPLLASLCIEHICLPSTDPQATWLYLEKIGGVLIKNSGQTQGPIFLSLFGHTIELVGVSEDQLPPGSSCHIAVSVTTKDGVTETTEALRQVDPKTETLALQEVNGGSVDEIFYSLVKAPGNVTLQVVWRKSGAMKPPSRPSHGGDNPEC